MITKNAGIPWKGITQLLGLLGGAGVGLEVTPRIGGYMDEKPARWASTIANSVIGQTIAKSIIARKWPSALVMLALGAGELAPIGISSSMKNVKATQDLAKSTRGTSIPEYLQTIGNSPITRGAGIGAALAGAGGTATGLFRPKSQEEEEQKATRAKMVSRDVLMALLPAMIAGGVTGATVPKLFKG